MLSIKSRTLYIPLQSMNIFEKLLLSFRFFSTRMILNFLFCPYLVLLFFFL